MKKKNIVLIAIIAVIVILLFSVIGGYNGLVASKEEVENTAATIEVQLERRADLIPNFVNTVKGYSDYEKETYTAVTNARTAVKNADTIGEQADANAQLDKAVSIWVNAVTEAYPELKANEQYNALTDELSGTENRIARARKDYNEAAKEYNVSVKRFPRSIIASIFGFEKVEYFEASEGANEVPKVEFD